jgi:Domain of unknown function (DUF4177)
VSTEYRVYTAAVHDLNAVSEALTKQAAEGWRVHSVLPMDETKGKLQSVLVVMERSS